MDRREFLLKSGRAAALAIATGAVGVAFHNREIVGQPEVVALKPDFKVAAASQLPTVVAATNKDPELALRAALAAIGGIGRFVKAGERVTIKPNIGWDRTAEQAANTSPLLVAEMVRQCLAAGAAEVVVSDISCNESRRCFLRSGIREAAETAGAKVLLPSDDDFIQSDLGGAILTEWPVLRHFIECDKLINMPIVKQHSLSRCTIGMKNLYGILGGRRNQLHQQIDQSIVDLTAFATPTLTVVDATRVLTRGGPQGGSLDDVIHPDTVICATDPVAADARGCEFLGLEADQVAHIKLAQKSGLGTIDYRAAGYQEIAG
ncbi:MAG: DUF362 domain-containing protein [bacterium]